MAVDTQQLDSPMQQPSGGRKLSSTFVTLLFTDIEGSTRLWEAHPEAMRTAIARHDELLTGCIVRQAGRVFKTFGDAVCAAFTGPTDAVAAAIAGQEELCRARWDEIGELRVRMALHSGDAYDSGNDFFGPTVNRVARILATGHGGQVLISQATRDLVADRLPHGLALRDLASHRLKDLGAPEHLFQVTHTSLPSHFPPLRSLQAYANNIPSQESSFVGRSTEMAAVKELLAANRLVTLVGPQGCGKSRLALQVAADQIERYGDGVWYLNVQRPSQPELDSIAQELARILGLNAAAKSDRKALDGLVKYLASRHALILFDNCDSNRDAVRNLAGQLLECCPKLQIVATAEAPIELSGEAVWAVPSMALPDFAALKLAGEEAWENLLEYDSVRLFLERIRSTGKQFVLSAGNASLVASICQRLGGAPSRIERAAAGSEFSSLRQLPDKLLDKLHVPPETEDDSSLADDLAGLRAQLESTHKRVRSRFMKYVDAATGEYDELAAKVKRVLKADEQSPAAGGKREP